MHVRFDAIVNILPSAHLRNDPGDSLKLTVMPIRTGATLVGPPEMHYAINANPVFDDFRATPTNGVVYGDDVAGDVRWATLPAGFCL
jgi:hypothetical protein